jgi:hypothetical protein
MPRIGYVTQLSRENGSMADPWTETQSRDRELPVVNPTT